MCLVPITSTVGSFHSAPCSVLPSSDSLLQSQTLTLTSISVLILLVLVWPGISLYLRGECFISFHLSNLLSSCVPPCLSVYKRGTDYCPSCHGNIGNFEYVFWPANGRPNSSGIVSLETTVLQIAKLFAKRLDSYVSPGDASTDTVPSLCRMA